MTVNERIGELEAELNGIKYYYCGNCQEFDCDNCTCIFDED